MLRVHTATRMLVQGADGKVFINRALQPGDTYKCRSILGLTLTTPMTATPWRSISMASRWAWRRRTGGDDRTIARSIRNPSPTTQTETADAMSVRAYRDIHRRKSRQIMVGKVPVGGDAPITVQTMTNTITGDARATIDQIRAHRGSRRRHRARVLSRRGRDQGDEGDHARREHPRRRRHPLPLQARHRGGRERRGLPAHQSRQYRLGRSA